MNTFVIERENIEANAKTIFSRAGDSTVIAVVKGRGYGFGLSEYVPLLHSFGVRHFAVTDVSDALEIRNLNLDDTDILMLRSTALSDELSVLIENDIILTIGSTETAAAANGIAFSKGKVAKAHIKLDTGMGRYGFAATDIDAVISAFTNFSNLAPCGLYTHLISAFKSRKITKAQVAKIYEVRDELLSRNIDCGTVHFANSAYLFRFRGPYGDAVRIGSAFTGRVAGKVSKSGLLRAGHLEGHISEIRWLSPGATVGYGGTYTAKGAIRTAVIPIGYSDGFHTEKARDSFRFRDVLFHILSDIKSLIFKRNVYVRINGRHARVLGHIGMTHTVCDVTDIPCNVGDTANFDVNPIYVSPDIFREFI